MKTMITDRHRRVRNVCHGATIALVSMPLGWECYFKDATTVRKILPRDWFTFQDMGPDEFTPVPWLRISQQHMPKAITMLQAHGSVALVEPGSGMNPLPYMLITVLPHLHNAPAAKPSLEDLL